MKLASMSLAALLLLISPAFAEVPRVVATIKPIHSLVAAVMGDLGTPGLLVKGGASPHTYSLRPSDAQALESADIVFWTGHGMELFLEDSLATLAPSATTVALSDSVTASLLPVREGGPFEPHEHEGEEHHEEHGHEGERDMHYWLDPVHAITLVQTIAATLIAADPEHGDIYADNATRETDSLLKLRDELTATLAPIKDVPYIVFHDAYQYFERSFVLSPAGSVTVTPDTMPGAQRIAELRAKIADSRAACVFAEPQFEPAIIAALIEGSSARAGTLDPEGATLTEGPGLYQELLRRLAASLVDCLGSR